MLKRLIRFFGGDPNKKAIDQQSRVVDEINSLEEEFEALSDEALRLKTSEFRARLASELDGIEDDGERRKIEQETLEELLPEAFAAVREASKRTLGMRHYDVQLLGGIALHQGRIAEMRTGEGKTLVATLPLYLNALTGRGVHLITVNDYLARRDARWMAPIYNLLGLSVGVLQMAARTENGKKAFVVDLEKESPHEDQHQLRLEPRSEAYQADITYGTNSEFGFDYLRDNMAMRLDDRVQRGHYYAIVDEVDNVLIDEARTPLIISGPAQDESEWYVRMAQVVRQLRPEDYEVSEKDRNVSLNELGEAHVEELLGVALRDPDRPEDVTLEQARLIGYLEQALRAQFLFRRNKDYLVQGGKVIIIDEFTGRLMPGRRWSDGLHQAVEAKEGAKVQSESVTYATITIQNYFRMYQKLAGMTGTAITESEEFFKIYKLEVLAIPTNLEFQALKAGAALEEIEAKDEQGYKYRYYARRGAAEKKPLYWKRKDYPDIVYRTQEAKLRAIVREIMQYNALGRPLLVGTTSVEHSERLSTRLRAEPLRRLAQVTLLRDAWFRRSSTLDDGQQIAELAFLHDRLEQLDVGQMRKLARELELPFAADDPANLERLGQLNGLDAGQIERLKAILQGGVDHQVLNARKHTEESQIIAGAGAFGAVTIATNMAGRGVDIKLGGELAEEVLAAVNRLLRRNGVENPYDLTMAERHAALQAIPPADYGIYEAEVQFFFRYMDDMARVRALGGLHVIGSERHEARRIDNQLRGRSARQGDPGSSRFFLAMDDDLMRLFGGQQADGIMQRFKIDDEFPLEFSIVGRIIEQSQTRVEGSNFDVRKHLLEYDDVLNSQRARIYAQRDRIFHKDDLSEDVEDMLRIELTRRVPAALKDEDGPWKLLDWLDQIQPTLSAGGFLYPPFSLQVLVERSFADGVEALPAETARQALLHIASESLDAEETHLVRAFTGWFDQGLERLQAQIEERREAIEAFFEGLDLEEEGQEKPSARQLAEELNNLARVQLRLTNDQQRALASSPKPLQPLVIDQITAALTIQALTRIMGAIERRLNEPLNLANVDASDWALAANQIITAVHTVFDGRRARLIGQRSDGQIARELQEFLDRVPGMINRQQFLYLLLNLREGRRAVFDKKTHRRLEQRTTRLVYVFFAAQLLESSQPEQISARVLEHLEGAQDLLRSIWGRSEWTRLSNAPVAELDPATRNALRLTLGEATYTQVENATLAGLTADEREAAVETLGRRVLTELYRQMLLAVITELWVDYLTQMEALRVSIGLEAYGQRDPLVQYKNRASGLFQDLLGNMRLSVISRMFTYQPRSGAPQAAQTAARSVAGRSDDPESEAAGALAGDAFIPENSDSAAEPEDEEGGEADETGEEGDRPGQAAPRAEGGGKRRRRRRR